MGQQDIIYIILQNIFWIIVGVAITRLLDKPIERQQRRLMYWLRGLIARFRVPNTPSVVQDEYSVGKWQVPWVVVEGSSSDPYTASNVICQFDPRPLTLPPDRQTKKEQIEQIQAKIEKSNGRREFHNGPTVALAGMGRGQIGDMEEPILILRLRPSDYYTFLATSISLNDKIKTNQGTEVTVRERYLRSLQFNTPLPEFASALAINLSLITSDGFIVVSKRATDGIGGYAGYMAPAINECINPVSDRSVHGTLSLSATAQRGASHEHNIEITDDELSFFTVGVDPKWYFWGVTGLIRSKTFSRADILSRRSIGSKEQWESDNIYFLPHNPDSIAKFMSDISESERWQPIGVVCLVQTMVAEFGLKATERALRKYKPHKQRG